MKVAMKFKIKFLNIFVLTFLSIFHGQNILSKIRLMTFHYNRPDFLELQCKCLNKFLKERDEYELIVFNDAIDTQLKQEIEAMCSKYRAICINYPQELHGQGLLIEKIKRWGYDPTSGSTRHCQLVEYALVNFGYNHDDIIGIFEGDVFLTRNFSIREALKDKDIISAVQTDRDGLRIEFLWIGLCFINIKNLPHKETLCFDLHFHNDKIFLDSGGSTYYYLNNNPTVIVKKYYRLPIASLPRNDKEKLEALGFNQEEVCFLQNMSSHQEESAFVSLEFHFDKHFLHFSFSRYNGSTDQKSKACKTFLTKILE